MTTATAADMQTRIAALEAEIASLRKQLDYAEAVAGIKRGQAEADCGLGIPLNEVRRQFQEKYGTSRT